VKLSNFSFLKIGVVSRMSHLHATVESCKSISDATLTLQSIEGALVNWQMLILFLPIHYFPYYKSEQEVEWKQSHRLASFQNYLLDS